MDTLKAEALKQGRWRLGEDGYIEKGPFPKDRTTVNVSVVGSQPDTGATILSLTPRHAGDSPVVVYATRREGLANGQAIDDLDSFTTTEGTLYFQARDSTGHYETGDPVRWTAELKIRHQVEPAADKRRVTLACMPKAALTFTLDGSNPRDGAPYESPFEIGAGAVLLLVHARSGEASHSARFQIPASGDKTVQIDDTRPVKLLPRRIGLDTTDRVFGVINRFRDQTGTQFKGVRIEIGEGENTVTVRFQEREVTAAVIEGVIRSLRALLAEEQAPVVVNISDGVHFDTGFAAKEFARIAGLELKPGDVTQET
jgi:hypothetical protein